MKSAELPLIYLDTEAFGQDAALAEASVAAARDRHEIVRSQRGVEVLGYHAAVELLRDTRLWAATEAKLAGFDITDGPVYDAFADNMTNVEGDVHRRQRKAVAPYFTSARAEELREDVRTWVDEWLDEQAGEDELDFKGVVGTRLPATVFCRIVGAPLSDADLVARLSEELLLVQAFQPSYRDIIENACVETEAYIRNLMDEKRQRPGDDLISAMLESEARGDITEHDIVEVTLTALGGSTDTTTAQMCLNLVTLAQHPDQWQLLKREPEHLPNAALELMRFNPGMWSLMRKPREAIEFRGVEVGPDDNLFACVFSANRDPAVFDDPGRLDVTRRVPQTPLNFGTGHHHCIGRFITLLELQEVMRCVLARWSEFEVVDATWGGAPYLLTPQTFSLRFASETVAVG